MNHIRNVLRMKPGEEVELHDGETLKYRCILSGFEDERAVFSISYVQHMDTELPCEIYLFQGLPKGDKMELIIQKTVELGVFRIVPVAAKRCVVKLDEKKAAKKISRWNAIARSAAEQSGRGVIPEVTGVMSWKQALGLAAELDLCMIPYEKAKGMAATKEYISSIMPGQSVGIFIGPEGGFAEEEIETAKESGIVPVTLGRRILRTETAGMTVLSILMYHLEND